MSNTMHIALPSISCGGCVSAVETALGGVAGVGQAQVSLAEHRAKGSATGAGLRVCLPSSGPLSVAHDWGQYQTAARDHGI